MNEPHQRTKPKLGALNKYQTNPDQRRDTEKKVILTGIENATTLEPNNADDEMATYLQTPTTLCNYQVKLLQSMAKGYGINSPNCIDRDFRRTWNIGSWHINNKLSISFNIRQPNIAGCWVNLKKVNVSEIEKIAEEYHKTNLSNSVCTVSRYGLNCQIKGRWTLNLLDHLLRYGLVTEENISISSLNISQSSLFCWVVLSTGSRYLCLLSRQSVDIICKYKPVWCKDITETSSAGSVSLKLENSVLVNDATQLSITETGGLKYQGRAENIEKLPEALRISIHKMMESLHVRSFLQSLQYKLVP